ncbi:hypothetical protein PVAP13_5KG349321 [Panicum virgatum]|uniref:Uncharacterized protein n=1 Tax=Panicum virgatum TaxID=38727 RepID=A0A8T0SM39_PANVG|nr:hypothetical protein PVAP13_5KG349321 [Panicum virgatum]
MSLPFPSIGSPSPCPLASRDSPSLHWPARPPAPAHAVRPPVDEPFAAPPRPPSAASWWCSSTGVLRSRASTVRTSCSALASVVLQDRTAGGGEAPRKAVLPLPKSRSRMLFACDGSCSVVSTQYVM